MYSVALVETRLEERRSELQAIAVTRSHCQMEIAPQTPRRLRQGLWQLLLAGLAIVAGR